MDDIAIAARSFVVRKLVEHLVKANKAGVAEQVLVAAHEAHLVDNEQATVIALDNSLPLRWY